MHSSRRNSANDLAVFQHGFRGIVVSNAHPELQALEGPTVYKSRDSFAAGVLDGLNHWLIQDAEQKDHVIRERTVIGV
jgi:hydroxymethylpyrimidine pyrophosphatase-like HAD family hydrolase